MPSNRLVVQLQAYLEKGSLTAVIYALLTSRLDHSSALYMELPLKAVWKLQIIQNAAARVLKGLMLAEHVTPVLSQLDLVTRAQFKVLAFTYKTPYGSEPK